MARFVWGKGSFLTILLVAASFALAGCAPAAQLTPTPSVSGRSITVLGQGTASAAPNVARAILGVETFASSVAEATRENSASMDAVLAKLKDMGIAANDIQTAGFSISTQQGSTGGTPTPNPYRVSNLVQVKIRNLQQAGAIIDAAVQAGANQVFGVTFGIDDPAPLEAQARALAVNDAAQRAGDLARLSSLQLGPLLAVNEGAVLTPVPQGLGGGGASGPGVTPINPGETQFSIQVQVTYAVQ